MEKKFKCPVCGREYNTLGKVKGCIEKHEQEEKQVEKRKKEEEIQKIKNENETLVNKIKQNCKLLSDYGIKAQIDYKISSEDFDDTDCAIKNFIEQYWKI